MSRNKLISIVCTLALLVGFFCVPNKVYAENTYIRNIRTYSGYKSSASLTYSATACQFHYNSDTSLTGGIYSPVLITVRFTNNGSNDVKIANSYVDLTFTNTAEVQRFDCYTSDLMVQVAGTAGQHTPRYNIIGGDGFSYNGHIVVPHNSSIYLVFEVDIAGNINTSSGQPEGPGLDAVFVGVADGDVQTGEFVSGIIPRQLDALDILVTNLYSSQAAATTQLQNMYSDVHTLLTDIKNQIRFTGTYNPPSSNMYNTSVYTTDVTNDQHFDSFIVRRTVYPSYTLQYDFEITGNNVYQQGYKRYVLDLFVQFDLKHPISYARFYLNVPYNNSIYRNAYINEIRSNVIDSAYTRDSYIYFQSNGSTSTKFILPSGRSYVYLQLYLDVPYDDNVTFTDYSSVQSAPYTITTITTYSSYYPHSIQQGLADIYDNLTGNTSQNDSIGNASDEAGTLSDQIHQQEETWYDENSAAMEAVGLSSYRFTNQQASGILGVTTQFEQLWLALGNWTLVYIFVLMASLATFVIRHEPSTRVKQMREMYMTDRAVARDWEMRTNPEKFSHRRWVENNRRH